MIVPGIAFSGYVAVQVPENASKIYTDDAVRQIAWHQEFLTAFPRRGSSANNHVIAEAAGRLAAACAFPWYSRTPDWRRNAAALLERELAANSIP